MIIKRVFLSFALISFFSGFFIFEVTGARAQGIGIRLSPVRIEELVEPGQVLIQQITIGNESPYPQKLYPYIRDFKAEGEDGRPRLIVPGTEEGYYIAAWIDIASEGIEFEPNESKTMPFTISVPADAGPGGYYGAILFGTKPPKVRLDSEDKGAALSVAQQTGSLILLQVKGDVIEDGRIREFNTDKNFYSTPYEVQFMMRLENLGNVHIKPLGGIKITNMFGQDVANVNVNEGGSNILPHSIRRFSEIWSGAGGFGRYRASLGLSYGTPADLGGAGKQTLYTEKTFWIIPWRIITPVFLGLIFILAVFILLLRLYKNKAVQKAMSDAGLGHVRYAQGQAGPSPVLHFSVILLVLSIVLFLVMLAVYFLFFA